MKLNLPYYSQHEDITDPEWKGRACTITNLAMVLGFLLGKDAPSPDELLEEGIEIGGYDGVHGWVHDYIVYLAHNHGVSTYREEFRSRSGVFAKKLEDRGIEKIKNFLRAGIPVIISIEKDSGSFHTVTLIGFDETGFFMHDPDRDDSRLRRPVSDGASPEDGEGEHMSYDDFWATWRRLCIFFE